jgi:NitT/TauT family transport system substrate-binding protein
MNLSSITRRSLGLIAGCALSGLLVGGAAAATDIKFTLDWKFEGPAAPFLVAIDKGYFEAEGLNVTIDTGAGSRESIPRVATGTYEMGFGDVNALAKFLDDDPAQKVRAVMMMYDIPPFAVIGRKSLGITADPKSLEGKKLGAPPPDAAFGQWPAFKAAAGIDDSAITIENVGFPVREPMLAQGAVDAIFGFSFSSILNLETQGVAADDIVPILMAKNGLDLYGNAVMVNTDFAAANPDAVKGFLRALAKGVAFTVANPAEAVDSVMSRNEILTKDTELKRLQMAIDQNIATDWVKENGVGDIDTARMDRALGQLATSMGLTGKATTAGIFDSSYLPAKEERMVK